MELKEVLLTRRSIRKFKADEVSDDLIEELLHAAMCAPSACNKQPWEFYVITNKDKIKELKGASMFTKYDSPLAIVVCGNLSKALPAQLAPYWIQDCSAAIENILVSAVSFGLGTCWCGLYPVKNRMERVKEILEIEDHIIPLGAIHIGYPKKEIEGRTQYDENKIHYVN
jgi:nitroreductase